MLLKKITHNEQKDILLNNKCLTHLMNKIRSKDHRIGTYETSKPFVLLWWWNIYPKQWIWWINSWRFELIIRKLIKQLILPVNIKIVPGRTVTNKMIEKLNTVFSNSHIFRERDSDIFTFFGNDIGLSISLTNVNFDDCDPESINHVRLKAWYDRYKQRKALKKR